MIWDDAFLDDLRGRGDAVGDDVVARYFAERPDQVPRQLLGRLVHHEDLDPEDRSPAVSAYLEDEPALPAWANASAIRRAEEVFELYGPQVLSALLLASLPESYAGAKGAQLLLLTMRLASNPTRRLIETAQMVIDVLSPSGLMPGARGYRTARRVRLMHAGIRWLIMHDPDLVRTCDESEVRPHWCGEWGHPVNQEDMLGTLLAFSVIVLDALQRMGVRLSPEQQEAYVHTWCVVGSLVGLREDLLPFDLAAGRDLMTRIAERQQCPSEAGRELTSAALRFGERGLPPGLRGFPATMMRYLVGDDVAGIIGVPRSDWTRVLLVPLSRLTHAISLGDQHDRLMRTLSSRLNRAFMDAAIAVGRGAGRPPFEIPDHLADRWRVQRA